MMNATPAGIVQVGRSYRYFVRCLQLIHSVTDPLPLIHVEIPTLVASKEETQTGVAGKSL